MRIKRSLYLALSLLLIILLSGCGAPAANDKRGEKPVRYALGSEPETLDPRKMTGSPEGQVAYQLFEGLTTQTHQGTIVPAAAERWEISADGLTYRFILRPAAKWSNGDPVTAHDFEFAWKSALSPELGSKYADQLYYLKNGEAYNTRKATADDVGVKALDDHTLEVTLQEPTAYFLSLCAFYTYFPVHKKTVTANPAWAAGPASLIGNGPFKLVNWVHNGKMEFVKNEHYWDIASVKSSRLEFAISDSDTTRLTLFENNQVDMAEAPPVAEIIRLLKEKKAIILPYIGTYFYDFNVTRPPFDDPRVRKAFTLAIDREMIVKNVTRGGQIPAMAWTPPGLPDARPGDDFRKTGGDFFKNNDIDTAKKLLAAAGFPDGKGLPPITLIYNTSEAHKAIAETIQEMWKKNLGVEIKLANQEWKVFINTRRTKDYQIARDGWIGDYADPMTFLGMFTIGNGNNNSGWKNEKYDALLKTAKISLDPAVRMQALHDAEALLLEDMPLLPIYYYTQVLLIKPNLKDVIRNSLSGLYFKEAYVE
ncbi:MAG TPA: peptide ABC transporter substrate-binding protein [Patescibacteria group bacterium]|nr:peptide ABC transporter substrate-binding protein [Patescibacteria group bacterium]